MTENHESITGFWSIPERAYEIARIKEALPHFVTTTADIKTMKTFRTKYNGKDNTESQFDHISF